MSDSSTNEESVSSSGESVSTDLISKDEDLKNAEQNSATDYNETVGSSKKIHNTAIGELLQPLKESAEDDNDKQDASEPLPRGRPSSCVFVASLCSSRSDDELCVSVTNHFSKWGKLSTVKVLRDTSNRPYAFVQYTNDRDSKLAIRMGHDSELDGRNIRCEAAKVNRTLFISSNELVHENKMSEFLSGFGEIEQILSSNSSGHLVRYKVSKSSKYWYCKFVYREDAIRAFANITESCAYKVDWTQNIEEDVHYGHRDEVSQETQVTFDKFSIFVGQLSAEVSEKDLDSRFSRHGTIADINLIRKGSNSFAFVRFEKESSAAGAVERENHAMFKGKTLHVQYKETHSLTKSVKSKPVGLAFAPPPIHLSRKVENCYRKTSGNNFPPLKPRFNNYSSNNANRGSYQSYRGNYKSHYSNVPNRVRRFTSMNTTPSGSAHGKGETTSERSAWSPEAKGSLEANGSPPTTPVPKQADIHAWRNVYGHQGGSNPDRPDPSNPYHKLARPDMSGGAPPPKNGIPYFYYIPNPEVSNMHGSGFMGAPVSSGNPVGLSPNPKGFYQPYYVPYDTHEYGPAAAAAAAAAYSMQYPMYYQAKENNANDEN
ncbi:regulator of IMe2 expression [Scheffersomyces stipitis CBS 6054]|uniref:Regulator of IMe2 expression n=1 Tax=Scheffersomyces stipitis (strain ATCC 58785 / CBS 6054 / NBRC 10063 / NRRL Y-11545) TaxID=322104 RepID=A3LTL5_PICST|nr:regulator of IMe2 expression [Scheffersomyces stipitis CBS 6054]ABN66433.2 regulator of IMe2 expression [Scheffersomyces stipitis CBS 6054]KAG2732788.1 hypothetical protein G9P44_003778 [Scheffersomyces stipitis]